jgi:hypothetical protein
MTKFKADVSFIPTSLTKTQIEKAKPQVHTVSTELIQEKKQYKFVYLPSKTSIHVHHTANT